jgi:AcrR family transcriptional regulator
MDRKLTLLPSPPLDSRMLRSRAALRQALLVLLEQRAFEQITVREITAQAKTGYATFFRHYDSKAILLNDIAAEQMRELFTISLPVLQSKGSRQAAMTLCRYVSEHRQLWSTLITAGGAGAMREEFIRLARQVPASKADRNSWLPEHLRLILGVTTAIEILTWWLEYGADRSVEQIAEMLDRLAIAPTLL